MKLPDFSVNSDLDRLRQDMNASLAHWHAGWDKKHINIDDILVTSGIDIPPDRIEIAKDATLEYEGRKVVVYIRDQFCPSDSSREELSKFHVADCRTLQAMRLSNRYERYVVTTRRDGLFLVNFPDSNWIYNKNESVERELYVCKNCLSRLNYNNYRRYERRGYHDQRRNEIRNSFSLETFFNRYGSQITIEPTHTDLSAPRNEYAENWNDVSQRYKAKTGWKCEKCRDFLDSPSLRKYLHVHHKNGLKNDNREVNLLSLCLRCHAEMPQHQYMKSRRDYKEYMARYGRR